MSQNTFDIIIQSPGRINLIGEHIDYNGGLVLPGAIDKCITLKFRSNGTNKGLIYSKNFDAHFEFDLDHIAPSSEEWRNYILGVVCHILRLKPNSVKGFDCEIESNLPIGSGLSSSAALECGIASGLNQLFCIGLSDLEIIKLSRDAEHSFVGTKCGIMDQFAVVKGKENHLLMLDCDTLHYELIPADFKEYQLLLLNSKVSHNLASSEYNVRRKECHEAMTEIQQKYAQYKSLAKVPMPVLQECIETLSQTVYNRALYVIAEQARTIQAAANLKNGDLQELGALLYASHHGLSELYEVSCPEIDFLVDYTKALNYVLGARMMGGGFGGCTINLVQNEHVSDFIQNISKSYKDKFQIDLEHIDVNISDGVANLLTHG